MACPCTSTTCRQRRLPVGYHFIMLLKMRSLLLLISLPRLLVLLLDQLVLRF